MTGDRADAGRTVIEVRDLQKSFRVPGHRPDTFKERAVHPLQRTSERQLKVLDGISFDVTRGEFFGVVGRNGSGKSTLLKLLASIYRADGGTIRVAGRVASVIELGVGFQGELSAEENIVLNCMMMGLTAKEAKRRFDAVIEFADLQDFVDLKLKNYSSGMRVRLAFATMLQADPDVLLLDEVLAVGDPPFQRKCEEAFRELRTRKQTTIVFVTNQMLKVRDYCDRLIVLEGGKIAHIGTPDAVAENHGTRTRAARDEAGSARELEGVIANAPERAVVTGLWLEGDGANGAAGLTGHHLELDQLIRLRARVEARHEIARPGLRMQIRNESHATVFFPPSIEISDASVSPAEPLTIEADIENKLAPGRYFAFCALTDHSSGAPVDASPIARVEFLVGDGGAPTQGLIPLRHDVRGTTRHASGERRP